MLPWRKKYFMWTLSLIFICLSTLQIHVQLSSTRAFYLNITALSYIRHVTETRCTNQTVPYVSDSLEPKHLKPVAPRVKVIVLSYMRSGSTLCGDLLQAHPDVFYVYEPLLYLWDYYVPKKDKRSSDIRFRAKTYWRKSKLFIPPPLDFISYMFNCNISRYNTEFLTNVDHSRDFTATGCLMTTARYNIVNLTDQCVSAVRKRCQNASAVVQKVVRLSMSEVDRYLEQDPSVKIIHLVRDPRGVLLSRMNFNNKLYGEMHNNYTYFCRRMREDIELSREIAHKHWGKILTVRYEDLAQQPMEVIELIYSFVGLQMLQSVRKYVTKVTSHDAVLKNGKIACKL
ncbi:hypothetical protein Btru_046819 [Bulinus truncatus]|nr:hypothetical protein Btru_046819 [Bulinus truncatus]